MILLLMPIRIAADNLPLMKCCREREGFLRAQRQISPDSEHSNRFCWTAPLFTWLPLLPALLTFLRLTGLSLKSPLVLYKISMECLNIQLVPGRLGEQTSLRIEVEEASKQGLKVNMKRRASLSFIAEQDARLQESLKVALDKKIGISLHSPDTQLVKRWHNALTRCRVNAGNGPIPKMKRANTVTSYDRERQLS